MSIKTISSFSIPPESNIFPPSHPILTDISRRCSGCLHRGDYDSISNMWICYSGPNTGKLSQGCQGFQKDKK